MTPRDLRRPERVRSSLGTRRPFTSVVSFGVAAMAMGLGVVFVLIGFALRSIGKGTRTA